MVVDVEGGAAVARDSAVVTGVVAGFYGFQGKETLGLGITQFGVIC